MQGQAGAAEGKKELLSIPKGKCITAGTVLLIG